jgi:hypothetical protein
MEKVLFVTNDVIGDAAAGPGIRYLELGRAMAQRGYAVTVMGRTPRFTSPQPFTAAPLKPKDLVRGLRSHDCVIVRGGGPLTTMLLLLFGGPARIISDYYAFTHLEVPHITPSSLTGRWVVEVRKLFHSAKLRLHSRHIDTFWVAHERQQSFLYGLFHAYGAVSPKSVVTVPFGYPARQPRRATRRVRGVVGGIDEGDFLLVWGGGVWDWLDPVTLVKAMAQVARQESRIKVYFMGMQAPSGQMPETGRRILSAAEELGLLNREVFVNPGWTPYEQRTDVLLEGDVGVSLHRDTLETYFSFRTRNLDYVYCGLPMIHSEGDVWADIIRSRRLGLVVPVGDADTVARAILQLYRDKQFYAEAKQNVANIFPEHTWDVIARAAALSIERTLPSRTPGRLVRVLDLAGTYALFGLRCLGVPLKALRRG